jgi:hypothetical protein
LKKNRFQFFFYALFAGSALVNISCRGIMKKFIVTPTSARSGVERGEKESIPKDE